MLPGLLQNGEKPRSPFCKKSESLLSTRAEEGQLWKNEHVLMVCNYRADLQDEEKSVGKYAIPFILGIYAETAIVGLYCLGLAAEKRDKIHVKMTGDDV